jgi:serine/threonine protein phosphatase PrpC
MPAIQLASGPVLLHAAKLVDVGRARDHQEDAAGIFVPADAELLARKGCLYVVADGMGGHNAGEIASQTALAEIQHVYYSSPEPDTPAALRQALASANQTIRRFAQADSRQLGMGTTAAVAVVRGPDVHVANVGDSRVYLVRNGQAVQITQDHSWVEEQVRAGVLTPEQARVHPQRNVVTRALGSGPVVEPDLFAGVLQEGDVLVLNSDGLTGHVGAAELGEIASAHSPEQAARRLVELANERGGSDNISVIVVRAEAPALSTATVAAGAEAPAAPTQVAPATGERSRSAAMLIGLLAVVLLAVAIAAVLLLRKPPETPPTKEALGPPAGAPAGALTSTVGIAAVAPITIPTGAATQEGAVAATGPPGAATATVTLAPTMSPAPLPSDTPTALPGRPITQAGVTATSAQLAGTVTPGAFGSIPAPRLAAPPDGELATANQSVTFTWDWDGRPGANQGFEVRIWREGAADHPGAGPVLTQSSGGRWQQAIQVAGAEGVKGQDGAYLWTVALVQASPYRRIGPEGTPRRLTYRSGAGSSGPSATTPAPTDTPRPTDTLEPAPTDTLEPTPTDTPKPPPPPPTP